MNTGEKKFNLSTEKHTANRFTGYNAKY